jgi:hypothetical protein
MGDEQQEAGEACLAEVNDVLEQYGFVLVPEVVFVGPGASIDLVPSLEAQGLIVRTALKPVSA